MYSDTEEDDDGQEQAQEQEPHTASEEGPQMGAKGPIMASMSRVPMYHTFRVRGILQGHRVSVLIDGGASHNFIDATMVKRRGIPIEEFEGFSVMVAGNRELECN